MIPFLELKRRKKCPLEKSFNLSDRDTLRAVIARMFYSIGLPFNLARNPKRNKVEIYC